MAPPRSKHKKRVVFREQATSLAWCPDADEEAVYENVTIRADANCNGSATLRPSQSERCESDAEMEARKQDLERLRAQFFPAGDKRDGDVAAVVADVDDSYTAVWASPMTTTVTLAPDDTHRIEHRTILQVGDDGGGVKTAGGGHVDSGQGDGVMTDRTDGGMAWVDDATDVVKPDGRQPDVVPARVVDTSSRVATHNHVVTLSLGDDDDVPLTVNWTSTPSHDTPVSRDAPVYSPFRTVASTIPVSCDGILPAAPDVAPVAPVIANDDDADADRAPVRQQLFVEPHAAWGGAALVADGETNTNGSGREWPDDESSEVDVNSMQRLVHKGQWCVCSRTSQSKTGYQPAKPVIKYQLNKCISRPRISSQSR